MAVQLMPESAVCLLMVSVVLCMQTLSHTFNLTPGIELYEKCDMWPDEFSAAQSFTQSAALPPNADWVQTKLQHATLQPKNP